MTPVLPTFTHRTLCNLCGSGDLLTIVRWEYSDPDITKYMNQRWNGIFNNVSLAGIAYEVNECSVCHFIFQKTVLSESFLYSSAVECTDERSNQDISRIGARLALPYFKAREVERMTYFLKKNPKDITVLDFGAGVGFWSRIANMYGFHVYALDTSNRKNIIRDENAITFVQDISEVKDVRFDFVHSDQVFEHVLDPMLELSRIVPLMNDGAVMYLSVPNCTGIRGQLQKSTKGSFMKEASPFAHINCFDYKSLTHLAHTCGLDVLSPVRMMAGITRELPLSQTLWMFQECLKYLYHQSFGTNMYFVKNSKTQSLSHANTS